MASGAVSLDTVMIKIESDSGKAGANIENLANKLQVLRNSIKGGYNNLNKLSTAIVNLGTSTKGLGQTIDNLKNLGTVTENLLSLSEIKAPSGLNSTIKRLNELSATSEKLAGTTSKLSSIGTMVPHLSELSTITAPTGLTSVVKNLNNLSQLKGIDKVVTEIEKVPQLVEPLSSLGDIVNPRGMKNAIENLKQLPDVINKIDPITLENLKRVSSELAVSLTPLADKMGQIAAGYSAFSKIQNTFGKSASASTKYMKQQKSILTGLVSVAKRVSSSFAQVGRNVATAFGKGAVSNLKKFHSKFKQVFLSLLGTRTLFTMIRKAAAEYEAFDVTLQKFSTNVWRAFGAQLAPVIEYVMELFKQFVRVIYSIVYALTGIDLIARANEKAMAEWGKSAKDTLGNLQKFDDLNVVEFDKGKGDEFEKIEMDKIDLTPIQKVIDWVKKLRDEIKAALDTGEWYNVGKVFAQGIGEGIDYLLTKIPEIRNKLFEAARDFGDFLNGIIDNSNWSGIGTLITESLILIPDTISELLKRIKWDSIGKGIGKALETFDPVKVINSFMGMLGDLAIGISTVLVNLPWGTIGKKFGDSITAVLKNITSILRKIPWKELGQKVREAIENVPWRDVWNAVVEVAKESFQSLNEFLSGLTGLDVESFERLEKALVGIGAALAGFKIAGAISNIVGTISTAVSAITSFGTALSLLGKGTLTVETISGITGVAQPLLNILTPLVDGFMSLGSAIGGGLGASIGVFAAVVVAVLALVEGFRELWAESEEFRNSVTELGDMIKNTFLGIIETAWTAIKQGIDTFKNFYDKAIKPVFDLLVDIAKPILEALIKVFNILWKNVIDPLVGFLKESFLVTWDLILIAVEALGLVLQPVISILEWLWKNILSPIVNFLLDKFLKAFDTVTANFKNFANNVTNIFRNIRGFLDDTINAMRGGWGSFWNYLKDLINKMITGFEKFINGIVGGINGLSSGLRKIGNKIFDIIGVDVKFNPISTVSLPRLETGTNEIPYEGIYHLHPGEAVVPKKYNPALGNGGSDEMVAKMDTLIDIMNNMSFTNVVNVGNKKLYEGQQAFNKTQQNKYGTINLY